MTLTPLERGLEIFAVIHLGLMGLSHVLQHRAWAEFFILLRSKGYAGAFVHGFLSLGFGAMIIGFHRVWWGLPMVLTVVGVLYLLKTLQVFLMPAVSMRSLNRISLDGSRVFIGAGVMFLAVASVLTFSLMRGG
ncbi:MAG TPA: hypothetical protein VKA54_23445 [Gemmatimonadaceae bacterium]|nr:hypothetical protein [Gemmatimonadaceae bacterium]